MSSENLTHSYPARAKIARQLIQSYNLPRGKDRLYLTLRSLLRVPRFVTADISESVRLNLDLDDYLQRWVFCHKIDEDLDYNLVGKILRAGEHFVDVGANIGIVSLIASKAVGKTGVVYAVEALPETRAHLQKNLEINKADNVCVLPFALLDENREVEFFSSTDGNIGGSSLSSDGHKSSGTKVQGRSFDSLISDGTIKECDVLKMDIEGAEILALKGMSKLFAGEKPRAVMIEVSDELLNQFGAKPDDVTGFFVEHGYSWYVAERGGFKRLRDLEVHGFNNLWAILPGGVDEKFLL
jgi:FkbM family methyltransferase